MKNTKVQIDLRIVTIILLAIILGLVLLLKPWSFRRSGEDRTISVSGESSIKAVPDEYTFNPMYQKSGADRAAIQSELINTVNQVVAKLKELGVPEDKISLSSQTYENYWRDDSQEYTSNSLSISVDNKELAQKVQDYLITTSPQGQITPYASFSKDKEKQVQEQARSEAIADAKSKAERMASELGVKLGKVVSIDDNSGGFVMPYAAERSALMATDNAVSSLPVLPGEQEVPYTISVTYELR